LANYEGVYLAISQAKKREAQPYEVVQEYIHEYFPRKCRHLSQQLKLGTGNEKGSSYASYQSCTTLPSLDEDITFTPGSMFQFNDSEINTPFRSVPLNEQNKSKRIVALTPSKFCNKSLGTPQRIPVDKIRLSSTEDTVIKSLEAAFDNPSGSLEEDSQSLTSNPIEEDKDTEYQADQNESDVNDRSIPPVSNISQNQTLFGSTPYKTRNQSLMECTPLKGQYCPSDPPQTPLLKTQLSEEEVNPIEYLRSTYPMMTSQDILQICQAIKPEDLLDNIDCVNFTDIDTSMFDRADDTENSLRRYSFVKFTKSSLCVQLNTVQRYGHLYGSSVVPKSQYDPTPVRRSKRLETKTPQTATKKYNRKI